MSNPENIHIRDVDFDNGEELKTLAHLYVAVPLSWDSQYKYTEETIQKNHAWLLEKRKFLKCLVAFDNLKSVGIHILLKEPGTVCFIKTLWVDREFRSRG